MRILIIFALLALVIVIPAALSYEPVGKYIWFNLPPAQNDTLGGIYQFDCPGGERAYAILENGTFLCRP